MARNKQLAAAEEVTHGLAFMEAGVPLMYLRADGNGAGAVEPMPNYPLTREQNLRISDVGAMGQQIFGVFDAQPSDVDMRVALEAMPYINSERHRRAMLSDAETWVWRNEAEIRWGVERLLETPTGFLNNEAIGKLCRQSGSPWARFAHLYPVATPKPVVKPAASVRKPDQIDRAFDQFLKGVKSVTGRVTCPAIR